jgi:hypothetical protein
MNPSPGSELRPACGETQGATARARTRMTESCCSASISTMYSSINSPAFFAPRSCSLCCSAVGRACAGFSGPDYVRSARSRAPSDPETSPSRPRLQCARPGSARPRIRRAAKQTSGGSGFGEICEPTRDGIRRCWNQMPRPAVLLASASPQRRRWSGATTDNSGPLLASVASAGVLLAPRPIYRTRPTPP